MGRARGKARVLGMAAWLGLCLLGLAACHSGGNTAPAGTADGAGPIAPGGGAGPQAPDPGDAAGRVFRIMPGDRATAAMVAAMVQVLPGDVIEFGCGYFELTSSLLISHTEDVRVTGCGRDKTVLSFKNNNAPEGILVANAAGITIENLTVLDTGGNGIELRGVDHGTVQHVRALWSSGGGRASPDPITAGNYTSRLTVACTHPATQDPDDPQNALGDIHSPDYTVSKLSGRYGIYPVSSSSILIDDAESIGASDAGIYVGQTNTAIIQNSRAAYNVFGFEIENVRDGEYNHNVAECNTGGFLIYDLDGLRQYGDRSVMHDNTSRKNNTYNFTAGGFVSNVPPGSGMVTLAYDRIDIYDNTFEDNNTAGIIHTSYEVFPEGAGRPTENRIDWYTEGLHVFHNTFRNNGNALPLPTVRDLLSQDVAKLLPAVVGLKVQAGCLNPLNLLTCPLPLLNLQPLAAGQIRGAHILWDGLLDTNHADCPYPVDAAGNPVPRDARGKPVLTNEDPNPSCHYNQYKFDQTRPDKPRIMPDWYSCIDSDNDFSTDSVKYANFHGTKGLELIVSQNLDPAALAKFPATFDMSSHQCEARYGKNLPRLPEVKIPPFVRTGEYAPAPSAAQVKALCEAPPQAGQVNFAAAAQVNCPLLSQYNLYADAGDPTSTPNSGGVPYSMNTKLFSDYAVKYRVAYLPPGQQATYHDAKTDNPEASIIFPTGTILAKTFSFADEAQGTEIPVETRLLIKRADSAGRVRWDAPTYAWNNENGEWVAKYVPGGADVPVHYDTTDIDSGIRHSGSTTYHIPNANQCLTCHSREDQEAGSAPIGPKVRFMNKPFYPESRRVTAQGQHPAAGVNQIAYWCAHGLMTGCPADLGVDPQTQYALKIDRSPVFNKPGSSGFAAGTPQDVEARARAWLEANCAYCHNARGYASNTGFYLDAYRRVDSTYGICKQPTATGIEGSGGHRYDIHPGMASDSIMAFRTGPQATIPAARMPPLARSVVDEEGHALVAEWIDTVVTADEAKYPGSTACAQPAR